MKPAVPIDVDPDTGIWSSDGLPMLYVPRHFFVNNHVALERALGVAEYSRILHGAGYQSAYTWCESVSRGQGHEHCTFTVSARTDGGFRPEACSPGAADAIAGASGPIPDSQTF
jgi:hypothetical protein